MKIKCLDYFIFLDELNDFEVVLKIVEMRWVKLNEVLVEIVIRIWLLMGFIGM